MTTIYPNPSKGVGLTVVVDPALIQDLDDWRGQQDAIPSRASVLKSAIHAFLAVRHPGRAALSEMADEHRQELAEMAETTAAELLIDGDADVTLTAEALAELAELAESADVALTDRAHEMRDELADLAVELQGEGLAELASELADDLYGFAEYEGEDLRAAVPVPEDPEDPEDLNEETAEQAQGGAA